MFYNIDSLVVAQSQALALHKATIAKEITLSAKKEKSTVSPKDTTAWKSELELFAELHSINKPINKGAYEVEIYPDTRSNLTVKSFTAKKDLPVRSLKVYYLKVPSNIKRIEAAYHDINTLYASTRYIDLQFQEVYNQPLLTAYQIAGGQKMFLADSVQYAVHAAITLHE